jgi:hypothetical protein
MRETIEWDMGGIGGGTASLGGGDERVGGSPFSWRKGRGVPIFSAREILFC